MDLSQPRVLPRADAAHAAPHATPARPLLGVIVLTYNAAAVIERTVSAALRVADHVFVVDSGSSDGTLDILSRLGCNWVHRPFVHYADQRNWAIDQFGPRTEWQLHLDADEVLCDTAVAAIHRVLQQPGPVPVLGFIFERRTYFMGRALRWGGTTNYHLRLFKTGSARCEDRLYDQHFVSPHPAQRLPGVLHDMNVGDLAEWTSRHNRWSSLEAAELARDDSASAGMQSTGPRLTARWSADPRERRRLYKGVYYSAPRGWRALALFVYRYVLQGGFLDGRAGFYYAFLQTLWFRMLVDAKLHEQRPGRRPP